MKVAAVILAAGAGRRLGGAAKALLPGADGRSFVATVIGTLRAAGVREVVVVVGPPYGDEVATAAVALGAAIAANPRPERGMASSVAVGFQYACEQWPDTDAALLWPVDHPAVEVATVREVLARGGEIVVPTRAGRGGHPTLFRRAVWPELAACDRAADGARSVVRASRERVTRFDVDDPGIVADVDTPADLG